MCGACQNHGEDSGEQSGDPPGDRAERKPGPLIGARNYNGPFRKTPGRLLAMALIRLYQLTFSALVGNGCRHMPSCSEYGFEAFARHGLWAGSWMTLSRVSKCGPGGTSGFDPVREQLGDDQRWWAPWRYLRR